jgi:signal transduction histidine kinase
MKLKSKIKISFALLTVVPILIIFFMGLFISSLQIRSIESKYEIDNVGIDSLINPTKLYGKVTGKVYDDIVTKVRSDVDCLKDVEYLKTVNEDLNSKFSFIIVKSDDEIIFNGCSNDDKEIVEKLPNYKGTLSYPSSYEGNSYIYGDSKYLIKQLSFAFGDGENGNIYIITSICDVMPQVKHMVIEMIITIIVVVEMTAIVLAIWVHRSIMNPLKQLGDATKRIAEGDLDFTLQAKTQDEFGALCDDFENMRKRLKESAEDKIRDDEESKELISNISHDLKTPITAIKGYVEGIMDGVADTPEKMEKYIKTIYNKANDMDKLIGELTVYSQIDTNRIPYNFKKVNVDDYFSDCVEEISVELEAKNIRLNYFNYVDKDTIIIADPEQLKRVVNNIISNSVKYIGNKQGALNIRINDDNDFVHVEIEDNGKGIQAKDLPYIFDRFYRTDSSRNSNQGGSGIGLAIAKKIIEVHGGKIWATSKVDTGTIMHFIIRKYVTTQNNVQA